MNSEKLTFKRAAIAGGWGTCFLSLGGSLVGGDLAFLLFGIPILGLPWLIYLMKDRSESNQTTDASDALGTLFSGSFLTLFCSIPVVVVWIVAKKLA